ncbi:MAG: hypothetical protein ACXVFT_03200 [Solirubrobacteraceae bacterium]
MGWFGTRVYIGAEWTVMQAANGAMTWTEITATNPFPATVALGVSFRTANGAFDPRFFATRTLGGLGQTRFLVRDLTIPNSSTGWFLLASSPTPIVPSATIYWARDADHVSVFGVPIQQLDADGFPLGDAAAQPQPPPPPQPLASLTRPPVIGLWAEAAFGEDHARAVLELFQRVQSAVGERGPVESSTYVEGVLVDEEADEFRRRFREPPER